MSGMASILAAAISATLLCGCGIDWQHYPSPTVSGQKVAFRYMFRSPDGAESLGSPSAVEFEVSAVHILIWSPIRAFHERASVEEPDPVCAVDRGLIIFPPIPWILKQTKGTDRFRIAVAVSGGEAARFDPKGVSLTRDGDAMNYQPDSIEETASPTSDRQWRAWTLSFPTACDPEGSYHLELGVIRRNGVALTIPRVEFVKGTRLAFGGP